MTRIVVVSDLHLDQSTAGVDRYDDIANVLWDAKEHAIKVQANGFLFLGDLADPHTVRSHRAVNALASCAYQLRPWNIPVGIIPGNHDVIEDGSGRTILDSLRWVEGVTVWLDPMATSFAGVDLMALPFTPTSRNYDPAEFVYGQHDAGWGLNQNHEPLIIGHLNLEGITPGSETTDMPRGRDVYWPVDALKECYPNALLVGGHYHTPQTFNGVRIVGSAVRLRFDEAEGNPGFVTLEL